MYRWAKRGGRVIESARNGAWRRVVLSGLVLFSFHAADNIQAHLTDPGAAGPQFAKIRPAQAKQHDLSGNAYFPNSFSSDTHSNDAQSSDPQIAGLDVVSSSGSIVLTMDEDWGSSDEFWSKIERKKKKKSRNARGAVAAKPDPSQIDAAPRSGLLTTRRGGSFFFDVFSDMEPVVLPPKPLDIANDVGRFGSGYRTLCVRLSDGYYWPVSFSTNRERFLKDRQVCKRSCAEPVRLFVYRNPGGRPEDMVDLKGRPYTDLENAWRYREEYSAQRKCGPHPWQEASLAKHRAYALRAKRAERPAVRTTGLRGGRKLMRVGHVRSMSKIDTDFLENTKIKAVPSVLGSERLAAGRVRESERLAARRQVSGQEEKLMRLGGNRKSVKKPRVRGDSKPPRYRRKPRRTPAWIREAFGED